MEDLLKVGAVILGAAIVGGAVYAGLDALESGDIDLSDVAEDVAEGTMEVISSASDFCGELIATDMGSVF